MVRFPPTSHPYPPTNCLSASVPDPHTLYLGSGSGNTLYLGSGSGNTLYSIWDPAPEIHCIWDPDPEIHCILDPDPDTGLTNLEPDSSIFTQLYILYDQFRKIVKNILLKTTVYKNEDGKFEPVSEAFYPIFNCVNPIWIRIHNTAVSCHNIPVSLSLK